MSKNFYITTPIYYPSENLIWVMLIQVLSQIFLRVLKD